MSSHSQPAQSWGTPTESYRSSTAALLLGAWLLVVLYATLFPFDFFLRPGASLGDFFARGKWSLFDPQLYYDIPRNVVLFVPFGLAAVTLLAKHFTTLARAALVLCVGVALSCCIEAGQYFLLVRSTTLTDIAANGAGTLLGIALGLLAGRASIGLLASARSLTGRLARATPPALAIALWASWLALTIQLSTAATSRARLTGWDAAFPLLVGNEATGDRPWHGTVEAFSMGDRALSDEEARAALFGGDPTALLGDHALARYRLDPSGSYVDAGGRQPDLTRQPGDATAMWRSAAPPAGISDAVVATGQLTLIADLVTASRDQEGPARIISLSRSSYARNLTIGQEEDSLVLRLRTPFFGSNGREPELHISGAFAEPHPLRLVVSYESTSLTVYLSHPAQSYSLSLRPETIAVLGLAPVEVWGLTLNAAPTWLYRAIYAGVVFGVAGALLAMAAHAQPLSPGLATALTAGIVLPPLLLELGLVALGPFPPVWETAAAGIAAGALGMAGAGRLLGRPASALPSKSSPVSGPRLESESL